MMKKFISIFLLGIVLISGCSKEEPVQEVTSLPFENERIKIELVSSSAPAFIRDIYFFDLSNGIAVTYKGEIFRTTDGGINWDLKYTNASPNQPLYQILFMDQQTGYVVGGSRSCGGTGCPPPGGILLKTTDAGNSWVSVFQFPMVEFVSIAANSVGDLFAIANGKGGFIFKSTNSGNDWALMDSVNFHLQKINFTTNTGFITGSKGNMLRSSDNGATWTLSVLGNSIYITDIEFIDGINYCLSNNHTIYQSSDNGNSWVPGYTSPLSLFNIAPLSSNAFLAFGSGRYTGGCFGRSYGAVRHSSDGGTRWTEVELSDIEPIRYSSFVSPSQGYAVAGTKLIRVIVK